ncbi:MAG: response regulator, partial [Halobacteriales archaeon]|nr:response regulator [Halobacteriales archaeon]
MTPTITVLLVADGSPGIPRASLLERRGFQVLRADDAIDALAQLDGENVDGVVCGVALESFPVDEFVTLAREHQPDVPLVLV